MGKLLSFKSFSVPLLVIFVFSFSSFFCFSYGDPHFQNSQATPTSGEIQKGTKRILLQEEQSDETPVNSSYLILAAKRTHRRDPLDDFKKYTGGWNISEKHYWASVGFTAVPPFVFAAIWFVGFGLCLSLICLCYCCCRRESYGYSRIAYALSLILLILFTVVAIVGCVVLYTGQEKFHNSISKTLTYVVNTANSTGEKLRDVSEYLAAAKKIQVHQVFLFSNVQTDIDEIQTKINSSATTLTERTVDNSEDIHDIVDSVRLALIIISAVMLSLTFIGFLLSLFGKKKLVYILVIIGWILVTGTFILCGVFLLLHNVTADSCVAMNQWVQNPTAHTALDDILPCVDNATALETLSKTKEVTSQLVNVVNQVITNVSNINFSPSFKRLYFNQSGPLLPILCNPFKPDFTNRTCAPGEIDLSNATKVWKNYVCQVSSDGICVTTGRLTPTLYDQMAASINVSYGLYHYGPFLVELQDCTFVRETFIVINREHCPGLRRYSKWVYIGMVMVSAAVLLSLVFWVIYGRERRHRVYTKAVIGHNFEGDKGT